ncbi:unnamed protein product [Ilex paraguariensis]|uniref:Cation-transporting P-type ATPase C-terminal domain-containing protein n=1 Tax=Ilex paraguariensis TaxID=185542 RepID=A0ABC8TAR5_9AQUA
MEQCWQSLGNLHAASDMISKSTEKMALHIRVDKLRKDGQTERVEVDGHDNPFLRSGTKVVDGYSRMLVTAVGKNKMSQKIHLHGELLNQFEKLTSVMGKFGHAVALLILLVMFSRLFSGKIFNDKGKKVIIGGEGMIVDVLVALVGIVATPAMIAATSAPEGLLLAVKMALAYSMKKMLNDNVVLRKPSLCDAIGSVTTICTNMTGSLTTDYKEVDKLRKDGQTERVEVDGHDNPFLRSGTKVVDGYSRMLVTAVGKNKMSQKIHLHGELLNQFEKLTSVMGKFGHAVALLILLVMFSRLFSGKIFNDKGKKVIIGGEGMIVDVLVALVGIVATPAMIAATSAPEGLLLAVKMALAYSMKKMLNDNVVLRKPSLCDAIGSVTTICTNMTGSLTTDYKEVNKFWLGLSSIEEVPSNLIAPTVLELLHQGIGLNTTQPPSRSLFKSPQNPTEKAIFDWAIRQMGMDIESLKRSCTILEIEPFSSENRQSGVLISKNGDNTIHVHRKGAPEVIIPLCSHYYETTGTVKVINKSARVLLDQILEGMAENGLRCIAFAHRKTSIRDYFTFSRQQLILLGLVGLKNSRRYGVTEVVEDCQRAGVNFRMITGNNILTARAIATKCGIIDANDQFGEVVEGVEFRNYTQEERMERVQNIRVMARATPLDKFLMVQCLKQKGHVVAVIGCGIGDVQALREANVGLCLGTQGADVAKACSDIVIQDKNLASVISILRWGRGIFESVQIYTQFLLTASFVALVTDFVMAISIGEPPNIDAVALVSAGKVPYPVLQLLWAKLVMGTLAALALIMKQPTEELMQRPPQGRNEPLMTNIMLRNIKVQALYQTTILLTIHFKGKSIFNVDPNAKGTLILNTYVLCQVFTIFNFEKNIFQDIRKRKLFWGIIGIILTLQVLMVEVLKRFADTARLDWGQWGTSIAIAAISLPISWIVKCISSLEKPFFSRPNWPKSKYKVE